jgi:hypothetical protein
LNSFSKPRDREEGWDSYYSIANRKLSYFSAEVIIIMNSLRFSYEEIFYEWQSLQGQWQSLSQVWLDSMRDSFEREFWSVIDDTTRSTLKEFEDFSEIIERAYREIPQC